jgi:glycosyltransferase involved in cell wall biosynthesis
LKQLIGDKYLTLPFFTVIIPTYNRAQLLRGAIQSVMDQTFSDFELLVVDDRSSDDTKQIIDSFKDDRITYILNDRGTGGAGTRNCAVFRAQGQWTAFLDDDDRWLPKKLEIQYKKIKQIDESIGLIYSGFSYRSSRKRWDGHVTMPKRQGRMLDDLLYDNYIGTLTTVIIRTHILKTLSGLDEKFYAHQDIDLYVRVAAVSNISFVNQCLATVLLSSDNRITDDYRKKLQGCSLFWEKHSDLIDRSLKLRHRAASRVFVFAVVLFDIDKIKKCLYWALLGLLIDPKNFVWMMRSTISLLMKSIITKVRDVIN